MIGPPPGSGSWIRNVDYYRLDGTTNAMLRMKWAEDFNNTANSRYCWGVLLLSWVLLLSCH